MRSKKTHTTKRTMLFLWAATAVFVFGMSSANAHIDGNVAVTTNPNMENNDEFISNFTENAGMSLCGGGLTFSFSCGQYGCESGSVVFTMSNGTTLKGTYAKKAMEIFVFIGIQGKIIP
ncbi:MAG: hypothetical protein LBR17_01695 [Bacteroidales bacterium]|jgi:hypothetical protein|nr:hypothetical protein [Bacteroidales bacterium]